MPGHRQRARALGGAAATCFRDPGTRPHHRTRRLRSPWLFNQIRQQLRGEAVTLPTGRDVWAYIRALWDSQAGLDRPEKSQSERSKKL